MNKRRRYAGETRLSWLTPILDAYSIHDAEMKKELEAEKATPACAKGCAACCRNATVPILQTEVATISWFLSEEVGRDLREQIKQRLEQHRERRECPFLIENACAIYAVRPLGCRGFVVLRKQCADDEDVWRDRRQDMFIPPRRLPRKVGLRILDTRDWTTHSEKVSAFEAGAIEQMSQPLHLVDWKILAQRLP